MLKAFQQMANKAVEDKLVQALSEALPGHFKGLVQDLDKTLSMLQVETVKGCTKAMEAKAATSALEKLTLQNFNTIEKKIDAVYAKLTETERKVMMVKDAQQEIKDGNVEVRKELAVQQQKLTTQIADKTAPLGTALTQLSSTTQPLQGALQSIKAVLETLPTYAYVKQNFDEITLKTEDCQESILVKVLALEKLCNDIFGLTSRFEKEQAAIIQDIAAKVDADKALPRKDHSSDPACESCPAGERAAAA